ncbi:SNF2-related protein, partial [Candidatus Synechococcus spongiarum]
MTTNPHIIDNHTRKVVDCLKPVLRDAHEFSVVSAYFTIYGYALLEAELNSVAKVRFLFGDPSSMKDLDPREDEPKSFQFTEHGLEPRFTLEQKGLARQCAEWVSKSNVSIRSARWSHFLHGKMYLAESPHHKLGIVGSSNFTQKGLGGSDKPNLEINLATHEAAAVTELLNWFNQRWHNDHFSEDVKEEVLNALNRIGGDQSPEKVYYKTLYELFYESIKIRQADEDLSTTGFQDSQIWNTLYGFQRDGAKSVIAKLREHNGCILADSVGLGKTYTALAVIKYFELRENVRVLVLCPKKLLNNWSLYTDNKNHKQNPFPKDRFTYKLLAHTDLRNSGTSSGGDDLNNFNWQNYNFVVIDESHNFRNQGGQRYKKLLEDVIKVGPKTKVLMLSATPVNTSLIDLRNQIYLMTEGRENAFSQNLNVPNIHSTMRKAQKVFKAWEDSQSKHEDRNKTALLEQLGGDFLRLLNGVSISRSRRQIEKFYTDEIGRIGQFPERAKPKNEYLDTDLDNKFSYQKLTDSINQFKLAIYQPSAYVVDVQRKAELESCRKTQNFNQQDSERFLVGMIRVNFLKRLESSAHSLKLTLERTINKIDNILRHINDYIQNKQSDGDKPLSDFVRPNNDEEEEEFCINQGRNPYHLRELDLPRWQDDLQLDRATLAKVLKQVEAITPERDDKLKQLKETIRQKVEPPPTQDREGHPNRKLLVFTTFKDTALYLYENLKTLVSELHIKMAVVSSDKTHATAGVNEFHHILTNFAPTARQRSKASDHIDLDLLIATDCISEGQNLQDC